MEKWEKELPALTQHFISKRYFPDSVDIISIRLHVFIHASGLAYGGVIYMRALGFDNAFHLYLVMDKTKVAPVMNLSMPPLGMCGTVIVPRLIGHCRNVFEVPLSNIYAWTDSTEVLI